MKIAKIFLFSLMFCLLTTNILALDDVLKPAIYNKSYTIIQTCSTCSFVYVTVSYAENGLIVANKPMTNNGSGVWTYNMTPKIMLRHDVNGIGDIDGNNASFATYFEVKPSGKTASTGDSILYVFFSLILFVFIILMGFFAFIIPSKNPKGDQGFETSVFKGKYFKMLIIALMWPLTILLFNFLNGIAVNYTSLSLFEGIMSFFFTAMLRLSWPFTIIIFAIIIVMAIHDTNLKKRLSKLQNLNINYFNG